MAAFATMLAAEQRAKAKMADGTWIEAFSQKTINGTIAVRVLRKAAPLSQGPASGAWADITDDAVV